MIIKTFSNDLDGLINKIGIFNKSFKTIERDFSSGNGLLISLFSGNNITQKDIQAIKAMDQAMQNGATTAKAWEKHMSNCTVAAKQQVKQCLMNKDSLSDLTVTLNKSTFAAKAATVATKALAIAGNMFISWSISKGIELAVTAINNYIKRIEIANEALNDSVATFKTATSELKDLNDELTTCGEKITELQTLADNGTISVADQNELDLLKETNDELERKIALKKAEQIKSADDTLKAASKALNMTFASQYDFTTSYDPMSGTAQTIFDYVTADQELDKAISKYEELTKLRQQALEAGTDTAYYDTQLKVAQDLIEKHFETVNNAANAYDVLKEAGVKFDEQQLKEINRIKASTEAYLMYAYTLNKNIEAYNALTDAQKKSAIISKLVEHGLNGTQARAIAGELSSEELTAFYDVKFNFVEPDPNDYRTAEEYGKAYAEAMFNGAEEIVESKQDSDISTIFDQLLESSESIDKFQSAVKSATDAYATLLSGNYSSSDLLDSIQSITKAVSDMGGSLNLEYIDNYSNPLKLFCDAIEQVSEDYAKSVLSGAGISDDFAEMLANSIIQAEKATAQLAELDDQIDSLQSAYNSLTDIVTTYNSTGSITFDQLQTLLAMEPQYLSCLVNESGQLQLNTAAMSALANQRLDEAEAQAVQQAITELSELTLEDEAEAVRVNQEAFNGAVSSIKTYNEALVTTIQNANIAIPALRDLSESIGLAVSNGASSNRINTVLSNLNTKLKLINSLRNSGLSTAVGSSSSSKSSSATDYKSILDKEITAQEKAQEAGLINFKQYLNNRKKLIEDYYKAGKISAEDYKDELQSLAEAEYDYYQKVLSAVTRRLDKEIDGIQIIIDNLKKQNEQLEKQQDLYNSALSAIKDFINAQKELLQNDIDLIELENDGIQDQIDKYDQMLGAVTLVINEKTDALKAEQDAIDERIEALQAENDEYQKAIELEQAKAALEKARNTRSKFIYSGEERGFIYQADYEAIADAEKDLSDIEFDNAIDALEKEKELLQDIIDQLAETEEAWQKISSAFDDAKKLSTAQELFGDNYKDIILNGDLDTIAQVMTAYIDAQQKLEDNATLIESIEEKMDNLDKLSDKWDEIATAHEDAINRENAALLLGQEWQAVILEGRTEDFENFKNNYLAIQAQIDDNQSLIDSYNEKIEYYENLKSQWDSIGDAYQDSVDAQLIALEFGATGEADILSGRTKTIENFRDRYVAAQQAISSAAWESANEQIAAAKEAEKGSKGTPGSAGNIGGNSSTTSSQTYDVIDDRGVYVAHGVTKEYAENLIKNKERDDWHIKVSGYSKGGIISKKDANPLLDPIAEAVGEDHMIAVKEGEMIVPTDTKETKAMTEAGDEVPKYFEFTDSNGRVLQCTPLKIEPVWDKMIERFGTAPKNNAIYDKVFDWSKEPKTQAVNTQRPINVSIGDIHLHEVQDADTLTDEIIRKAHNIVIQKSYKQ